MKTLHVLPFLILGLSGASAHFELIYPPTRGFEESTEPMAPCGGYNSVQTKRADFPLSGGFVIIESGHVKAKVDVNIVLKSSAAESDFTQVQANLAGKATTNSPGSNCIGVDLKAQLGVKDGQNATIQVRYDGGDSILYQCADVVLKMNPTNWNSTMCNLGHGTQPGTNQATTAIHKSAGTVVVCTVAALFGVLFS